MDYKKHLNSPFSVDKFKNKIFEFKNKSKIRIYKIPPVRNFLVENIDGKWLYWGLVHIIEIKHDYINQVTSGKFKVIHIYSPDEMNYAHRLIDRNKNTDFLRAKNT